MFFNECKAYKKIYLDLSKPESDNKGVNTEVIPTKHYDFIEEKR